MLTGLTDISDSTQRNLKQVKEDLKAKSKKGQILLKNLSKLVNDPKSANDKFGLGYGDHRYDGILSYENEVLQSVFMNKESEIENQPLNDRIIHINSKEITGIVDCGCSRHMPGNIANLAEFKTLNGGPYEGFLVGYSLQSKAFRVYNLETKRVEENLHITFLENKPNVAGKGPTWLFDLDYLTDSMNYHPDSDKEDESAQDCFVLPIWPSYSSTITPALTTDDKREGPREEEQVFMDDLERLKRQEKEANEEAEVLRKKFEHLVIKEGAARTSSTNIFSTVSTPAKASSTNLVNTVSIPVSTASPHEGLSLSDPTNPEEDDSEIPPLEDIYQNFTDGIFPHFIL
ncbi:hypothetical protein Tco_1430252 [Tanacetum coccineum]